MLMFICTANIGAPVWGCRITSGRELGNVDLPRPEKVREVVDDAGLVKADDIDGIGKVIAARFALTCLAYCYREIVRFRELVQRRFEFCRCVPVSRNKQKHRELGPQGGHSAFEDVAATLEDDMGQFVDDARPVTADSGNHDKLLTLADAKRLGKWLVPDRSVRGKDRGARPAGFLPCPGRRQYHRQYPPCPAMKVPRQ